MPVFKNLLDCYNYAKKSTIETANEALLKKIKGILFDFTIKNVYSIYDTSEYTRTMELLFSITKSEFKKVGNNKFQAKIYYDNNKIHPYSRENQWNAHMSINNIDISTSLPYYIEYGTNGSLWDRPAGNMVKDTKYFLEKNDILKKELRKVLIAKGFKIKYIK